MKEKLQKLTKRDFNEFLEGFLTSKVRHRWVKNNPIIARAIIEHLLEQPTNKQILDLLRSIDDIVREYDGEYALPLHGNIGGLIKKDLIKSFRKDMKEWN